MKPGPVRVQYQVDGGLAYLPGLRKPITIDPASLPEDDRRELDRLIDAARFFEQPARSAKPPRGADYQQHTLTIEAGDQRHTVQMADPIEDSALRELLEFVRSRATRTPR
jgi:hypothetical protein